MIHSQGEFLTSIQHFLASLNELKEILESYQVSSIKLFKQKIDNKDLPEHPSYEDYLDCLSLYNSLKEMKSNILEEVQGINFESFR